MSRGKMKRHKFSVRNNQQNPAQRKTAQEARFFRRGKQITFGDDYGKSVCFNGATSFQTWKYRQGVSRPQILDIVV